MELLITEVVERFYSFVWPMLRISAFFLVAHFFPSSGHSSNKGFTRGSAFLDDLSICKILAIDPSTVTGLVKSLTGSGRSYYGVNIAGSDCRTSGWGTNHINVYGPRWPT